MSSPHRTRLVNPRLGTYFGIFASAFIGLFLVLLILEQLKAPELHLRVTVSDWPPPAVHRHQRSFAHLECQRVLCRGAPRAGRLQRPGARHQHHWQRRHRGADGAVFPQWIRHLVPDDRDCVRFPDHGHRHFALPAKVWCLHRANLPGAPLREPPAARHCGDGLCRTDDVGLDGGTVDDGACSRALDWFRRTQPADRAGRHRVCNAGVRRYARRRLGRPPRKPLPRSSPLSYWRP